MHRPLQDVFPQGFRLVKCKIAIGEVTLLPVTNVLVPKMDHHMKFLVRAGSPIVSPRVAQHN